MKKFSSAQGDHKKNYPQQEDLLEQVKPALLLEEEFNDLFLKDLVWAHAVSLHQQLDTLQFKFAAPLVALLKRGLQDQEQVEQLGLEVEFVVRYAATVGGRNLKLVRVCLSKVWAGQPGNDVADLPSPSSFERVLRGRSWNQRWDLPAPCNFLY